MAKKKVVQHCQAEEKVPVKSTADKNEKSGAKNDVVHLEVEQEEQQRLLAGHPKSKDKVSLLKLFSASPAR
jgi:hypothetical protein